MTDPTRRKLLRRYTSLPSLLHILQTKKLTLLDPAKWDDKNDAFFMSQYAEKKKLESVLALCFSDTKETYHHWRVFTEGSQGVCISFVRKPFIERFRREPGIKVKRVTYKQIKDVRAFRPKTSQLPFTKREPYRDEVELRLVYDSAAEKLDAKEFDIDLALVDHVTLSPWLTKPLDKAVKDAIHSVQECSNLKIYRTTLLENEAWNRAAQ